MSFLRKACTGAALFATLAPAAASSQPIEPLMVAIPEATFSMGSDASNITRPVHTVALASFNIGSHEVTVREFRQFIEATGFEMPQTCRHELDDWMKLPSPGSWDNNYPTTNEFQPVVCIGWGGAKAYADWLAKTTGRPYRLPTEAEWEYAALEGATTRFHFGDDPEGTEICAYGNSADLAGEGILQRTSNTSYVNFAGGKNNCVDHAGYSSVVGMYKPNRFGLYDTIGNVFEFVQDCFLIGYEGAPLDGSARTDAKCTQRTVRGSSWHWKAEPQTARMGFGENFIGGIEGFRLALDGPLPDKSDATIAFERELKQVQAFEQKRRNSAPPYPATVSSLALTQSDGLATLRWDTVTDADFYRVYRNYHKGGRFRLIADNIVTPYFHDANLLPGAYEYRVAAVRANQQGDYSSAATTTPGVQQLPGRLETEFFSSAEGAAASAAYDESRQSYGLSGASGRGGIAASAVARYRIVVTKAGSYRVKYRVAANRDSKGFELWIGDLRLAEGKVMATGGYWQWQTQEGQTLQLEEGSHKLELRATDSNWKINWIELNPAH